MTQKNTFIAHRWDGSDDYEKIASAVEKAGLKPSDRSVSADAPLDSSGNHLMHDIHNKIDTASTVFIPARPNATREGSVSRKEIDYALEQGKTVIAVDTKSTSSHSSYLKEKGIPIVPARKDSIANAVKDKSK
ncbi:MAG: hypothetical protein LBG97_06870 [Coriobacteriales bacterium]|jgi:hypothetical protein|nr:hypothetical protein [Coriobacteriales bacterium]